MNFMLLNIMSDFDNGHFKVISYSLIDFGSISTSDQVAKKVNPKAVTLLDSNLVKSIIQMIHSETVKNIQAPKICHLKIPQKGRKHFFV